MPSPTGPTTQSPQKKKKAHEQLDLVWYPLKKVVNLYSVLSVILKPQLLTEIN